MFALLNLIYLSLLLLLSPVILWRVLRHGRYRRGLPEKLLGRISLPDDRRPVAWFHAVSVGEVIQLQKVVDDYLKQNGEQRQILITTSTDTGFDLAQQRFPDCQVSWFPLDFSWAVSGALDRIQPDFVVLMELELWPGFLTACFRRHIPVAVVNARLSERSFRRYQLVRRWMHPVLGRLQLVAAQSPASAQRLQTLGVREEVLHVTGSVKFDGVQTSRENAATIALRKALAIPTEARVLVCGSTQDPEEKLGIDAWQVLRRDFPDLYLILVPRHRERFDQVATTVTEAGHPLLRKSQAGSECSVGTGPETIRLLDTIGELGACWGLADFAFVGGSFGNRGGQNMIEPAAYGAAVMFGPNTRNFRDVVRILQEAEACIELQNEGQLLTTLQNLMQQPEQADSLGRMASAAVIRQQGATNRTTDLLLTLTTQAAESLRAA
ncbi:MAG: 3-deoxy-D-manno-octulosonic acid transferase [Planctomycetaceae bacterium]